MTKAEQAMALMNHPSIHYGCAQAVLIPFAGEIGITEAQAAALAQNFSGGMGCGAVCGSITGALMALGGLGFPQEIRQALIRRFRAENGCLNCAELLKTASASGEPPKEHCMRVVQTCVDFICMEANLE